MTRRSSEKASFWRLVLEEHGRSGLSVRDFCLREGLSVASFYGWKRSLRTREAEASSADPGELIPVKVVDSTSRLPATASAMATPLELVTPSGYTLRFPATLAPCQLDALLGVIAQSRRAAGC